MRANSPDHPVDAPSEPCDPDLVPEAFKEAAETVRGHLCALRGGAPFLSSTDAVQLMRWFEGGVSTTAILLALERASEARRRRRSKIPLRLSHAQRHLGRASPPAALPVVADPASSPEGRFAQVIASLPPSAARDELARGLEAIAEPGEPAVMAALGHVQRFLERELAQLGEAGLRALHEEARVRLGDLLEEVDETTAAALLDETARDLHRARYPALTVATLWECVERG